MNTARRRRSWWRAGARAGFAATLPGVLLLTLGGVTVAHAPLAPVPLDTIPWPATTQPRLAVTASFDDVGDADPAAHQYHSWDTAIPAHSPSADLRALVSATGSDGVLGSADLSYSPDGSRVVFTQELEEATQPRPASSWALMVGDVVGASHGSDVGTITNVTPLTYPRSVDDVDYAPTWSPDGRHIAFVREPADSAAVDGTPEIQVLDLETPTELLTVTAPGDDVWSVDPSWAPDGTGLIFRGRTSASDTSSALLPPGTSTLMGEAGLWYFHLDSGSAHRLVLDSTVCLRVEGQDPWCEFSLPDLLPHRPRWSPTDATSVAFLLGEEVAIGQLTLPATLPTEGEADVVIDSDLTLLADETYQTREIAWSADGSQVLAATLGDGAPEQIDSFAVADGTRRTILDPALDPDPDRPLPRLASIAAQPWSDLGVELEVGTTAVVGEAISAEVTITNHGPSPARPGEVLFEPFEGGSHGVLPTGCGTQTGGLIACDLVALDVGDTAQFSFSLTPNRPGEARLAVSAVSDSPDASSSGASQNYDDQWLTISDVPTVDVDGHTERISFTMQRVTPGFSRMWSDDLVQTVSGGTSAPVEDYRVLTSDTYESWDGTRLRDEDNVSYSPDGSQVVYDRTVDPGEESTDPPADQRLAIADVEGAQEDDPGTFRDIADLTPPADPDAEYFSDTEPSWSPATGELVFVRSFHENLYSATTGSDLLVVDPADPSGAARSLFDADWLAATDGLRIASPTWRPDGSGVVFAIEGGDVPEIDAPEGLWYLDVTAGPTAPSRLMFASEATDCAGLSDSCDGIVPGDDPTFSPDGSRLALTAAAPELEWGDSRALFVADVPADLGTDSTLEDLGRVTPEQDPEAQEYSSFTEPAWSLDGSGITVVAQLIRGDEGGTVDSLVTFDPVDGSSSVDFIAPAPDYALAHPAYEPTSDLSIELTGGSAITPGPPTSIEWIVTNEGPSPARDATWTIDLPASAQAERWQAPTGCELAGSTLTCTAAGPIDVGQEITGELPVRVTEVGSHEVTATLVTNSIDTVTSNDRSTAVLTATARPYPATERISFSLERGESADDPSDGPRPQFDLVQSIPEPAGEADPDSYLVLADSSYPELLFPDGSGSGTPLPADEDNLDYSPDGSRVVYDRLSQHQYSWGSNEYSDARQLVVADVYGQQQGALGEPGTLDLANLTPLTDPAAGPASGPEELSSDTEPVWSPDATRIAFVRSPLTASNDGELAILDVASGDVTYPLADLDGFIGISSPTWSPNGEALIVAGPGEYYADALWYVSLSDPIPRPLVLSGQECVPSSESCGVDGSEPAWSPDGERLAFTTLVSDYYGLFLLDLPEIDPAETADIVVPAPVAVELADPAIEEQADIGGPTWSPDGTRLAVSRWQGWEVPKQVIELDPADPAVAPVSMYSADHDVELAHPDYVPVSDLSVSVTGRTGPTSGTEITVDVRNEGPSPARDAIVTLVAPEGVGPGTLPAGCALAASTVSCVFPGPIPLGDTRSFTVPVTLPSGSGDHEFAAAVATNSIDPVAANDEASTTVRTSAPLIPVPPDGPDEPGRSRSQPGADLRVRIALENDRAWLGGDGIEASIVVRNDGPATAEGIQLTLDLPEGVDMLDSGDCPLRGVCLIDPLGPNRQATMRVTMVPTQVGELELGATVAARTTDPRPANNTATAAFEGVQAKVRLLPAVAYPGEVTLLYGVDLPPDARITARWTRGITGSAGPVSTRDDGTLRFSMLIIAGDELGEREVEIGHVSGTTFGLDVPPRLLVVPRGLEPPEFVTRG